MAADFEVKGADQFYRLSKALKDAGHVEMRKFLHKSMCEAANKAKLEVAKGLAEVLPNRIADRGLNVKQLVQVKTGTDPGVTVAVRFGVKAGRGLGAKNAQLANRLGKIRHPVYADGEKTRREWRWVDQSIGAAGWFDKGWMNQAPAIRKELEAGLVQVADDVVRKARG
jgi:hypothetical protein